MCKARARCRYVISQALNPPISFCRLVAEKINKNERKGNSEIENVMSGKEPAAVWKLFGDPPEPRVIKVT